MSSMLHFNVHLVLLSLQWYLRSSNRDPWSLKKKKTVQLSWLWQYIRVLNCGCFQHSLDFAICNTDIISLPWVGWSLLIHFTLTQHQKKGSSDLLLNRHCSKERQSIMLISLLSLQVSASTHLHSMMIAFYLFLTKYHRILISLKV
jgi:hypothetical protein